MMKMSPVIKTAFSIVLLSYASRFMGVGAQDDTADICVIGAGPAGIQAAYRALEKGYTVRVFEKNSYIGGRTKETNVDGSDEPYYVGALIHMWNGDGSLEELITKFNITTWPRALVSGYMDEASTTSFEPPSFQLLISAIRYSVRRYFLGRRIDGPDALNSDYPDDAWSLSLFEWLDRHRLGNLKMAFWFIATAFGYGDMNEIPAIYILLAVTGESLLDFLLRRDGARFVRFQQLIEAMASTFPDGSITLNAEISQVEYTNEENTTILYSVNGSTTTESAKCGSTIIAFPPLLKNIDPTFVPPSAANDGLVDLLEKVQSNLYFTFLFSDADNKFQPDVQEPNAIYMEPNYEEIPQEPNLNLCLFEQQTSGTSSVVAYFLATSNMTNDQAVVESLDHYGKIIGDDTIDTSVVQEINRWDDYFPHVSKESLGNDFYKTFDKQQGKGNQYYVGGFFTVDLVQHSMQHASYIIDRFF